MRDLASDWCPHFAPSYSLSSALQRVFDRAIQVERIHQHGYLTLGPRGHSSCGRSTISSTPLPSESSS